MPSRAGFRFRPLLASRESCGDNDLCSGTETEIAHRLLRLVLGFLWAEPYDRVAVPARRVFYKFESGGWRSRSTRQLDKVYRCR